MLDEIGLALVLRAPKPGPAVCVAGNAVNLPCRTVPTSVRKRLYN